MRAMILLTSFYRDPDGARHGELIECLCRNAANNAIDEIHLFVEEAVEPAQLRAAFPLFANGKVRLIPHGRRVAFRALFAHANAQCAGCCAIIANADIYFDVSLRRLQDIDLSGQLLCLSRWDVQPDGTASLLDFAASQDAWIFQVPVRDFWCDFPLGIPGCENRLAWEAERAGLRLSNPSKSVRANHLHLSGTRRYSLAEKIPGPYRAVAVEALGAPWLWFVVTAAGCEEAERTVRSLEMQPRSSCVVADGSASGVVSRSTSFVTQVGAAGCNCAGARNRGAGVAEDDGILCFFDAGVIAAEGFSEHVHSRFQRDQFLVPDRKEGGPEALVCDKAAFASVGGFDETVSNSKDGLAELRAALLRARLKQAQFSSAFLSRHENDNNPREAPAAGRDRHSCASAGENAGRSVCAAGEILAAIRFHESMGYTVARLSPGVSSHNNDTRPIEEVPEALLGRAFTQVVSCSVSPIDVEFLELGKLYVLVGTDWDGYHPATAWLREKGNKEMLPEVKTVRGTTFEVWSVQGRRGDRLVIPTQVALVGDKLVQVR